MTIFEELGLANSPTVKAALEHKCGVCGAAKGECCTNIANGYPLHGRLVHYYRIEDK